jgi:hypothetical protein
VRHLRAALPAAVCPDRLRRLLRRHQELLSRQESIRLRKSDGFMISRP